MALISGRYKIVIGDQQGRGVWFGPVYPNGTRDGEATPCAAGCLYDIYGDPTEHVNLKDSKPALWSTMLNKLLEHGKTVYQTDYAEPGTASCLTGEQAARYYVGHNTCDEPHDLCASRSYIHACSDLLAVAPCRHQGWPWVSPVAACL